jgi:hypothetical protein
MKKTPKTKPKDVLRKNYDFSRGVRGKYAERYAEGTNVVFLAPDVAKVFTTSEAVNEALRGLIGIAGTIGRSA